MLYLNKIIFSVCLLTSLAVFCFGGGTLGETPFNFLFIDGNPETSALGGAYAAISDNSNALFYNPAGLAFLKKHEISFSHNQYFQDMTQNEFSFAWKIGKKADKNRRRSVLDDTFEIARGWGFAFNLFDYGPIKKTTLSNPDGSGLGSVNAKDFSANIAYGRRFGKNIGFGFSGKLLQETIASEDIQAIAFDAGMLVKPKDFAISFGLILKNFGPRVKTELESFQLPTSLNAGFAWRFNKAGFASAQINMPQKGDLTTHYGMEYELFNTLAFRIGYNGRNETDSGLTYGIGLLFGNTSVNYAFESYGKLGFLQQISLNRYW